MSRTYVYILIMVLTVSFIRILPLTLIRKPIENRFIRDFLYYVPYVTLTVMTFPSMVLATDNVCAGMIAFVIGSFFAYRDFGLFKVTVICCLMVFILELLLI